MMMVLQDSTKAPINWSDKWADFGIAFVATLFGVLIAQLLSNYAQNKAERRAVAERARLATEAKAERVKKLKSLLVESLDAALNGVWKSQADLKLIARAPGIRIPLGLIGDTATVFELYEPDLLALRRLMICGMMIEAANDRIGTIARLDYLLIEREVVTKIWEREHAGQVVEALKYLALLEEQTMDCFEHLDADRLKRVKPGRAKLFDRPA